MGKSGAKVAGWGIFTACYFRPMKGILRFSLIALVALLAACGPERVVEQTWPDGQPKVVAYVSERGGKKLRQREEKFYESGTMEYSGSYDEAGKRHGEWHYFYPTGVLWSLGVYAHGQMHGKKEVYWPDGTKRYEGFFANDQKSGHWVFYNEDGSVLEERDF